MTNMAGITVFIGENLRLHRGVMKAPLTHIIRKNIGILNIPDVNYMLMTFGTSDDGMLIRMLHTLIHIKKENFRT